MQVPDYNAMICSIITLRVLGHGPVIQPHTDTNTPIPVWRQVAPGNGKEVAKKMRKLDGPISLLLFPALVDHTVRDEQIFFEEIFSEVVELLVLGPKAVCSCNPTDTGEFMHVLQPEGLAW